jgi:hypothetical protein
VPGLLVQKGGRRFHLLFKKDGIFYFLNLSSSERQLPVIFMNDQLSNLDHWALDSERHHQFFFLVSTKCLQCCEAGFSRGWMLPYPIFSEAKSIVIRLK